MEVLPDRTGVQGPFDRLGKVKQGYAFPVPADFAERMRENLRDRWPAGSSWVTPDRRFWIFQSNPAQWSLATNMPDLAVDGVINWLVTRYRTDIQLGDGVLLWEAGPGGGIYGLARVVGIPELQPAAPYQRSVNPNDQEHRVAISITRRLLPPIGRDEARGHPVLRELDVLRIPPMGTNFQATQAQWRAVLLAGPLVEDGDGDQEMNELAALVSQFKTETGYSDDRRGMRDTQREELAAGLTAEGLTEPDVLLLRRLAGPAYGSPGPQPGFNTLLQTDEGIGKVVETLTYLIHDSEGTVEQRLEACLSGEYKLPRVGEAMLVKALAVVDPGRWIPCYPTGGKVGKLQILKLLGHDNNQRLSPAQLAAASNDRLRALLEPHLPGDPWGMQEFSWWLLHRERVPETSLKGLADGLYLTEEFLDRVMRLLDDKGQIVFYGPPGTGKTYVAQELAKHIARGGGVVRKVQFHPSYAYEDFVEGYRPTLVNGHMTYEIVDGPLKEIAVDALERRDVTHVLLIDELNRANIPRVLGELLYLMEYRDEQIRLQYSKAEFSLPSNLRIIATMNTADRSVAQIDAALRRRFHFVPFFPDTPPINDVLRRWLADKHSELLWIADIVARANAQLINRHLAIGPSHFMIQNLDAEKAARAWEHSVMPYLEEQFFEDPERLAEFSWSRLREQAKPSPPTVAPEALVSPS